MSLKDVDWVDGGVSEVPQTEGGVTRGGHHQSLGRVRTAVGQLLVMTCPWHTDRHRHKHTKKTQYSHHSIQIQWSRQSEVLHLGSCRQKRLSEWSTKPWQQLLSLTCNNDDDVRFKTSIPVQDKHSFPALHFRSFCYFLSCRFNVFVFLALIVIGHWRCDREVMERQDMG